MGGFLPHIAPDLAFDVVIANPPYFKLNKADPRAASCQLQSFMVSPTSTGFSWGSRRRCFATAASLVYITPRSFASGPYFRLFRERFFDCIRPELVHVFGSRREAFGRDAVLQENVIMKGVRQDGWSQQHVSGLLTISSSQGVEDLSEPLRRSSVSIPFSTWSRKKRCCDCRSARPMTN